MSSHVDDMIVFARAVETGSLTEAARQLGSTRSAVSKAVARLEKRLGTRLLHRTTRELSATAAGQACYVHCARLGAEVEAAERAASEVRAAPQGRLRVSCTGSLGGVLAPQVPRFCAQYPDVELELALGEELVDLVREGIDLGVRLGRMPDSSLVARKLAGYRPLLCASPAYLAKRAAPKRPRDLASHACILRIGHDQWRLRGGERVGVRGNVRADSAEIVRGAVLGALGIALLPSFVVAADLSAGALVEVLPDHAPDPAAIYAVYPNQRYQSPNVRAFIDFVAEAISSLPEVG